MKIISSLFLLFIIFFAAPGHIDVDSAELYPGKTPTEIEAEADHLVREFYKDAGVQVDALFQRTINERHPGAAIAVIKDGRIIHSGSYGLSNLITKEKITQSTSFLLASISKQFTALAILMLEDQGFLSIDDKISKYFDDIPSTWDKITIRHLITHSSGLPDRFRLIGYGEGMVNEDILDRLIKTKWINFTPGKRFRYSNSGYNLLALIVEKVSETTFREFLQEEIFEPLKMTDTYVYDETMPEIPHRAVAYRPLRKGRYRRNDFLLWTTGASGIFSSAEDMYKWDQALYTNELVSLNLIKEAFTPQIKAGRSESYGFGWRIPNSNGVKSVYHTGTLGGSSNIFFRIPDLDFSIVILSNRSFKPRKEFVRKITDIYLPGTREGISF